MNKAQRIPLDNFGRIFSDSLIISSDCYEQVVEADQLQAIFEKQKADYFNEAKKAIEKAKLQGFKKSKKRYESVLARKLIELTYQAKLVISKHRKQYEEEMVDTVIEIIEQILAEKPSKLVVVGMVKSAINRIKINDIHTLYVSRGDFEDVKTELEEMNEDVEVRLIDRVEIDECLESRECYLSWTAGTVHLDVHHQIQGYRDFLKNIPSRLQESNKEFQVQKP